MVPQSENHQMDSVIKNLLEVMEYFRKNFHQNRSPGSLHSARTTSTTGDAEMEMNFASGEIKLNGEEWYGIQHQEQKRLRFRFSQCL